MSLQQLRRMHQIVEKVGVDPYIILSSYRTTAVMRTSAESRSSPGDDRVGGEEGWPSVTLPSELSPDELPSSV